MVTKKAIGVLALAAVLGLAACSRQQSDWEKTRAANTTDAYEGFQKKYPSGEFTAQAKARAQELYEERDWQKARDTDTAEAYQAFLKQHPEGKYTEEARIRVENFTLAAPPTNPPSADTGTPTASIPRGAAAPTVKPSSTKPAAPEGSGHYGVQLGAFKSNADSAQQRWTVLTRQYPKSLAGFRPKVSPKKTSSGTLYRLQVVDLSQHQALAICKALGAKSCLVLKPGHS